MAKWSVDQYEKCRNKKPFTSEEAARMWARNQRRNFGGFMQRPYQCHMCGAWHLTKKQRAAG